jgi:HSP20 family molecular chaperone IbpA
MRYRYLRVSYAVRLRPAQAWLLEDLWPGGRLRPLAQPRWRPDADTYVTATAVEVLVDLAGVEEDEIEVQLFDNAVVVEGRRRLPRCAEGAVYEAAAIRQGPFRLELPLPARVDPDRVTARSDRGLLHITLPKRPEDG